MDEPELLDARDPRVFLSAERTLLSWIRTALAMMGLGFVVARFGVFLRETAQLQQLPVPRHSTPTMWMGIALVAVGVLAMMFATWEYVRSVKLLKEGRFAEVVGRPLIIVVAVALVLIGIGMGVYLLNFSGDSIPGTPQETLTRPS